MPQDLEQVAHERDALRTVHARIAGEATPHRAGRLVMPLVGVRGCQRQVEDGDLLGGEHPAALGEQQLQQPFEAGDVVPQWIA